VACLIQRLIPSGCGRSLRGRTRSSFKSSPFCRPRALSCALPLSSYKGEESSIGGDVDRCPSPR
jgi:hypothetical protein